jgi:hypothetical protein
MGAGSSNLNKSMKNVFSTELEKINDIVSKVITKDDKFIDANYNFLFEETCSKYTVIWEKQLGKHLKVDLDNLSGSIYLVEKKDNITNTPDNVDISKQDLCNKISKHYIKILYIFSLIKTVYDLEHAGDDSIAGIMQRNVKIIGDDIMELNYCSVPHKDYDIQPSDKINFDYLQGFKLFVEHFLTPIERYAFLEQFKAIFARQPRHKVIDAICQDSLVPLDAYEKLYSKKFEKTDKKLTCNAERHNVKKERKTVDLMFEVVADNPILHTQFCFSHKKLVIPLKSNDKETRKVEELYKDMHKNYVNNVDNILKILYKIVDRESEDKYVLKNISSDDLEIIIKEVKQNIVLFYMQSIVDYQVLLDGAKSIPNIKV